MGIFCRGLTQQRRWWWNQQIQKSTREGLDWFSSRWCRWWLQQPTTQWGPTRDSTRTDQRGWSYELSSEFPWYDIIYYINANKNSKQSGVVSPPWILVAFYRGSSALTLQEPHSRQKHLALISATHRNTINISPQRCLIVSEITLRARSSSCPHTNHLQISTHRMQGTSHHLLTTKHQQLWEAKPTLKTHSPACMLGSHLPGLRKRQDHRL